MAYLCFHGPWMKWPAACHTSGSNWNNHPCPLSFSSPRRIRHPSHNFFISNDRVNKHERAVCTNGSISLPWWRDFPRSCSVPLFSPPLMILRLIQCDLFIFWLGFGRCLFAERYWLHGFPLRALFFFVFSSSPKPPPRDQLSLLRFDLSSFFLRLGSSCYRIRRAFLAGISVTCSIPSNLSLVSASSERHAKFSSAVVSAGAPFPCLLAREVSHFTPCRISSFPRVQLVGGIIDTVFAFDLVVGAKCALGGLSASGVSPGVLDASPPLPHFRRFVQRQDPDGLLGALYMTRPKRLVFLLSGQSTSVCLAVGPLPLVSLLSFLGIISFASRVANEPPGYPTPDLPLFNPEDRGFLLFQTFLRSVPPGLPFRSRVLLTSLRLRLGHRSPLSHSRRAFS